MIILQTVPNYATLSDIPSIFDDKIMGHADFYFHHNYNQDNSVSLYVIFFIIVSLSIVVGLSTPLFVTIVDSIEMTNKGKPKLYYHFWSSVLLTAVGIWGVEVIYNVNKRQYSGLLGLMILDSFSGVAIAMITAARQRGNNLFSAPLSEFCCGDKCRTCWLWLMTHIGFFILLSMIVYLLYAIPTIVLSLPNTHTDSCTFYHECYILHHPISIFGVISV